MKQLQESNIKIINQLSEFIEQFSNENYSKKLDILSGSSIGMHVRHILEFYSCFLENISNEEICYDSRQRQLVFEVDVQSTIDKFDQIKNQINSISSNNDICIASNTKNEEGQSVVIKSSLFRELLYTLDHAIHHMALIKIGAKHAFDSIKIQPEFGIAPSTLRFQKAQCAQ